MLNWGLPVLKIRSSFKKFDAWTNHDEFLQLVESVWRRYIIGNHMYVFQQKLKATKNAFKSWSVLKYGSGSKLFNNLRSELYNIQHDPFLNPIEKIMQDKEYELCSS